MIAGRISGGHSTFWAFGLLVTVALAGCECERRERSAAATLRVRDCQRAARNKPKPASKEDTQRVFDVCSLMYSDQACREAVRKGLQIFHRDGWHRLVIDTCGRAYCPNLSAPRPRACAEPHENNEQVWAELNGAIIAFETGGDTVLGDALDALSRPGRSIVDRYIPDPNLPAIGTELPLPRILVRGSPARVNATLHRADGGSHYWEGTTRYSQERGAIERELKSLQEMGAAVSEMCPSPLLILAEADAPYIWVKYLSEPATDAGCDVTFHVLEADAGF